MRLSPIFLLVLFLSTTANQANAALTATTANVIQGTAPYIELNSIRATGLNSLLSIKVNGKTYYSDGSGYMYESTTSGTTFTTPIELPTANMTLGIGVTALVTADGSNNALNSILSASDKKDDDGDGNFTIQGSLKGEWRDASNTVVSPSTVATGCNSPYTLTLTVSGNASIETQYGLPKKTSYPNSTALFKVNPKLTTPYSCWAQPNLANGAPPTYSQTTYSAWDKDKGFLPQTGSNPNFPTMGAHGLFFDLTVAGTTAAEVIIASESVAGTSTVTSSGGVNLILAANPNGVGINVLRVTLDGPRDGAQRAFSPTTFEIKSGSAVIYSFTLSKWFIARPLDKYNHSSRTAYCNGLTGSYGMPVVNELTNANGNGWTGGLSGQGNNYSRRIGGGLLAEWGVTARSYYGSSDFVGYQWNLAKSVVNSTLNYSVGYDTGQMAHTQSTWSNSSYSGHAVLCVSQ